MSSTLTDKLRVANPEDMDKVTFAKHMTHRHGDSLGGMESLDPAHMSDEMEGIWRAFHDRLHRVRVDLGHEHERPARHRAA
jgi:hypothetical protein